MRRLFASSCTTCSAQHFTERICLDQTEGFEIGLPIFRMIFIRISKGIRIWSSEEMAILSKKNPLHFRGEE